MPRSRRQRSGLRGEGCEAVLRSRGRCSAEPFVIAMVVQRSAARLALALLPLLLQLLIEAVDAPGELI